MTNKSQLVESVSICQELAEAASYYIDRLEKFSEGKVVRDLGEAQSHWRSAFAKWATK